MFMAKTKPVMKAAALDKTITSATESLTRACSNADAAVTAKTAEEKKLNLQIKQHTKKKTTLTKRNKTAAARLKKDPSAVNKKAAATVAKELKAVKSALDKIRATKATVSTELTALKTAAKRLTAYTKGINAADKVLNKPVKKKRSKARK
jgi:chromosome segregation ATPase